MKTSIYFPRSIRAAAMLAVLTLTAAAQDAAGVFPDTMLPPPTGTYRADGATQFANGVVIQELDFRLPSQSALPQPPVVQQYRAQVSLNAVLGDGVLRRAEADAMVTVRMTAGSAGGFDTEMLQFDVQGGSLPVGAMIRESPTRASTGKTVLDVQSDCTFRIGSFFDIFTEVSVDGGMTWSPAVGAVRCNLKPVAPESSFVAADFPPQSSSLAGGSAITFANGFVFRKITLHSFAQSQLLSEAGLAQVQTTLAAFRCEVSSDNGANFTPLTATASLAFNVRSGTASDSTRYFDTEMLALSFSSGAVMIRESPTKASLGRASLRSPGTEMFRIGSFFDIFTELSVDGGQTWTPATSGACTLAIPESAALPEHFFATDCFPAAATYETPQDVQTTFPNGVVIRNFRHRPNAIRAALPQPGAQQTRALGGSAEFDLSRDGGGTFTHYYVVTLSDCLVSGYSVNGSGGFDYPMESVSLNFTLPGGVMVRESPTKRSLGRTSILGAAGGHMIGSFFDIFTEVSLDAGQTWTPADGSMQAFLLPYVEQDNVFASDFHPPRHGSYATRRYAGPVGFPNGTLIRDIRFEDFTKTAPPPVLGSRLMEEEGIFYFFMSTDGGKTWVEHRAPAHGTASLDVCAACPAGTFDTEMLSLDVGGGTLPAEVMIRESPTKRSLGRIGHEVVVDFLRIGSFFDVFTELSVDGGATWLPAETAARLELHARTPEVFNSSDFAPLTVQYRESDFDFAGFTGNAGIRAVVIDDLAAESRQPLPSAGASLTQTMAANVSLNFSLDGGKTFAAAMAPANVIVRLAGVLDDDVRGFDTEMLALDVSGGTLPAGVALRESPTRASLGRTTVRACDGGFRIGSFFDVFIEISTDSGATWTPLCDPIRIEAAQQTRTNVFSTELQPPAGVLASPSGGMALACATGQHIKDVRLTRSASSGQRVDDPAKTYTAADSAMAEFSYSSDGGHTFVPVRARATFRYEMKNVVVSGVTASFDTEMLELDISGGTLPAGVMLRESPTRASTGRTFIHGIHRGYRIGSFFDVWPEISTDGGGTWQPFDAFLHIELENTMISGYSVSGNYPAGGDLVPTDQVSLNFTKIAFGDGSAFDGFDVFQPTGAGALPGVGETKDYSYDALGRLVRGSDAADGVQTFDAPAHAVVRVTHVLTLDGRASYDTEMVSLDLHGGTLPAGTMLRESPTLPSRGRMLVDQRPGGTFRIGSFFDVFTEISTDGGATWSACDGSVRLTQAPSQPPVIVTQPASQRVLPGANVRFGVVATGSPPLGYQWLYKGRAIAGATDSGLLVPAVKAAQSGHYSVLVTGPGGTVVSAGAELLVVHRPFALAAGNYTSLILPAPGAEATGNVGFLKLKLTNTGAFTGTAQMAGMTHRLRGAFDLNGDFHTVISREGLAALSVTLHIDLADALDLSNPRAVVSGTFATGMSTSQASAERIRFFDPANPSLSAGRYTVLMQSDLVSGSGYAKMDVTKGGAVTISGTFLNTLPFTFGGFLDRGGELPLFVQMSAWAPGGSDNFYGGVYFRDIPFVSDCDARLVWNRFQGSLNGTLYGYSGEAKLVGSRYVAPPRGARLLHFANTTANADLMLRFSTLNPFAPPVLAKVLTVRSSNSVSVVNPAADQLKMSFTVSTGLFSGTFVHPATGAKRGFGGAVLQKQEIGGGIFSEPPTLPGLPPGTGAVELSPR